jgi:hypothetical protein
VLLLLQTLLLQVQRRTACPSEALENRAAVLLMLGA